MHRASNNTVDHYPQKGTWPIQRAEDGTKDRPKSGDVDKLNHEYPSSQQGHIVHPIVFRERRSRACRIDTEDFFDVGPINKIRREQNE
jgi:hypothetical protein